MTLALLALALGAAGIHSQPAAVTLGKDSSAQIEVDAVDANGKPLPHAKVSLSTTVGELSAGQDQGNGHFRARYTPPKEKLPQVALIQAEVESEGRRFPLWLSLPLEAKATLKIETKPRSSVTVSIGDRRFGPATADGKGRASIPAVVPPGFAQANVQATDRAGNTTDKPLDLGPRPFQRVRAWVSGEGTSWADPQPAEILVFAVEPTGKPLADAKHLRIQPKLGEAGTPTARGEGVFSVPYRAPEKIASGRDTITVGLDDSTVTTTVEMKLDAGPPTRIVITPNPESYVAGTDKPVKVRADIVDARDNVVSGKGAPEITTDFGTVEKSGADTLVKVPDSFEGRKLATLHASLGRATGESEVPLKSGPAAKAELSLPGKYVRAGDAMRGEMVVTDAYGNPVEHAKVDAKSATGEPLQVEELGGGKYAVSFTPTESDPTGSVDLDVRSGELEIARSPVTVLPYQRPWGPSIGVFAVGTSNLFGHVTMVSPRVELALTAGRSSFEFVVDGEYDAYGFTKAPNPASGNGCVQTKTCTTVDGNVSGFNVGGGGRYSFPLGVGTAIHLQAVAGILSLQANLNAGQATGGQTAPFVRGAAGASFRVGSGRIFAQLEGGWAPGGGSQALIQGNNILGAGIAAGYVFSF